MSFYPPRRLPPKGKALGLPNVTTIALDTDQDTLVFGARLAAVLQPGDVVALSGGLGAGKTTLARGLIQSRLGEIDVPSPTYTLVQTYAWGERELWHCDLYRMENPADALELGLLDAMGEEIVLLEWPDRLGDLLPDDVLSIDIAFEGEGRIVTLTGFEGRNV